MAVDAAYNSFAALKEGWDKCRPGLHSEQDVRFNVIDRMLTEVLGWAHSDIKTEPNVESGYVDYLVTHRGRNRLVVEAKRASALLVDTAIERVANYQLGGAALRSAKDGVSQAQRYCSSTGVQFAGLTTGFEWIAFWAVRSDGRPPTEGKAIVFPNLNSIGDNFALFYDLFSPEGILNQLYQVRINEAEGLHTRHVETLHTATDESEIVLRAKSSLAADLEQIYRRFFTTISGDNDPEMLAKCFVETKESREADVTLKKITSTLLNRIDVLSSQGTELETQIREAIETSHGEYVLIIGNKGAGKSTFIDRFFRLVLDRPLRGRCLILRVDLADSPGDTNMIVHWLTQRLKAALERELFRDGTPTYEELQGVFIKDYDRWRIGERKFLYENEKDAFKVQFGEFMARIIDDDPNRYVRILLEHAVGGRRLMPCLIFDNTDHFAQSFQEGVFQYGQSIFRSVFAFVICPITDRTIWQLSKSGPLQSYETKALYLPVPSTKDVVSRRIKFIREKATDNQEAGKYFLNKGIRVHVPDIGAFASCVEDLLINEDFVGRLIGHLSNHDIRRSLRIAQRIITSPVISIDELVKSYLVGRRRRISTLRIELALLLGDYTLFNHRQSDYILNLFTVNPDAITSPLLKLSLLQLLRDKAFAVNDPAQQYRTVEDVLNYFEPTSLFRATVKQHLLELLEYRLIEPYNPTDVEIYEEQRIRVTYAGHIHWEFVLGTEHAIYMANMALTTPVREENVVSYIRDKRRHHLFRDDWNEIASKFMEYCLRQDELFITLPAAEAYESQRQIRQELSARWISVRKTKRPPHSR